MLSLNFMLGIKIQSNYSYFKFGRASITYISIQIKPVVKSRFRHSLSNLYLEGLKIAIVCFCFTSLLRYVLLMIFGFKSYHQIIVMVSRGVLLKVQKVC